MSISTVEMRPTFQLESEQSSSEILRRIEDSVAQHPDEYQGKFAMETGMVSIHPTLRHFWSPWLHFHVQDMSSHRLLHCRFSPHPSIWTGIMFSYLSITFSSSSSCF